MKLDLKYGLKSKRDKDYCEVCNIISLPKLSKPLHQHRIVPGGEYTDDNVVIVCQSCHNLIHKLIRMTPEGLITDYNHFIRWARQIKNEQEKTHSQVSQD